VSSPRFDPWAAQGLEGAEGEPGRWFDVPFIMRREQVLVKYMFLIVFSVNLRSSDALAAHQAFWPCQRRLLHGASAHLLSKRPWGWAILRRLLGPSITIRGEHSVTSRQTRCHPGGCVPRVGRLPLDCQIQ